MKSPFEDLQINSELVCEFAAVFMRFEYAMKASDYCAGDRWHNAVPNWKLLKDDLGMKLDQLQDMEVQQAIQCLLKDPPQVQKFLYGRPGFQQTPLLGATEGAKALEAAKRVRNNLFHGGKHTPHSPPERDTRLLEASFVVLRACLALNKELASEYEHQIV